MIDLPGVPQDFKSRSAGSSLRIGHRCGMAICLLVHLWAAVKVQVVERVPAQENNGILAQAGLCNFPAQPSLAADFRSCSTGL